MESAPAPAEIGPLSFVPPSLRNLRLRIMICGAEGPDRQGLETWLSDDGCEVISEPLPRGALPPDVILLELASDETFEQRFERARRIAPEAVVIVLAPSGELEVVLSAMRLGAFDCLVRPLQKKRFTVAMTRAGDYWRARASLRSPDSETPPGPLPLRMGGKSRAISELRAHVARVAERDVAVFLEGERGSGVEIVARAIHSGSSRAGGPFLTLDCSAYETQDHELQLAGREHTHSRGTSGVLEQATGGTLYVDNVDRLSSGAQAVLSAYLAHRQVRRLDGGAPVMLNTRIIASADSDLRALVARGAFREDLYFRLVVYPIKVPSLRERPEDVPMIVGSLVTELSLQMGAGAPRSIEADALEALSRYPWPGNVRELENVIQRSMLSSRGASIISDDLPLEIRMSGDGVLAANQNAAEPLFGDEIIPLREIERRAIEHALRLTDGNVAIAAKKLGIGRATLYRRIASLEVSIRVA
jgi:DNA-binding NtrC family response regulator